MERTISVNMWGSSFGLRLPSDIAKFLGIQNKSLLNIRTVGDEVILRKSNTRVHKTFADRMAVFNGEYNFEEADTGCPVGNEVF